MERASSTPDAPDGMPLSLGAGGIRPLDPAHEAQAAAILAAATGEGTPERRREEIAAARDDPDADVYELVVDGEPVAVYILRRSGLSMEVISLAVAESQRRKGYGRACLVDALRRAGRRPLVVETDDEGLSFYQAVGFKLVGKRRHPSGTMRYRLGWHAPRMRGPEQ